MQTELISDIRNTNREVSDSLVFQKYVSPVLGKSGDMHLPGDSISIFKKRISGRPDSVEKIFNADVKNGKRTITTITRKLKGKELQGQYTMYVAQDSDSTFVTDTLTNLPFTEPGASYHPDSQIAVILAQGLKKILTRALIDSGVKFSFPLSFNDTALVQNEFKKTLAKKGKSLQATWLTDSAAKKSSRFILLTYSDLEITQIVGVSGYGMYLAQKILPQSVFGLLLLVLVATAFIVTYRNLQRQAHLSEMKNSLISNMSHELKTPVATVKVALEALADYGVVNNPKQALEYIDMARMEANRLEMLINKALNASLMEQGRITVQCESIDIAELMCEIINSQKLRLQQAGAIIDVNTQGDNFFMDIDKLHVQGAILNIIDNSIKYCGNSAEIDIDIIANTAGVIVNIADNGPGIPPEYAEQVFEPFFRVPSGDKHNVQGYGLGLSYVKQVMQLHNGIAQLKQREGGGVIFSLQFFRNR